MTKPDLIDAMQQAILSIGSYIHVEYYEDGTVSNVDSTDISIWLDRTQPELLKKLNND